MKTLVEKLNLLKQRLKTRKSQNYDNRVWEA